MGQERLGERRLPGARRAYDLVYVPRFCSHVELAWDWPPLARFYRALASFSRLITFDRRGTGMSDPVSDTVIPSLEARMEDVRALIDAAGADEAALMGVSERAPLSALFAATYSQRTRALVLVVWLSARLGDTRLPALRSSGGTRGRDAGVGSSWGSDRLGDQLADVFGPSSAGDPAFGKWFRIYLRRSPSDDLALYITYTARGWVADKGGPVDAGLESLERGSRTHGGRATRSRPGC